MPEFKSKLFFKRCKECGCCLEEIRRTHRGVEESKEIRCPKCGGDGRTRKDIEQSLESLKQSQENIRADQARRFARNTCPSCGKTYYQAQGDYCTSCGTQLSLMFCKICQVSVQGQFCHKCGSKVF